MYIYSDIVYLYPGILFLPCIPVFLYPCIPVSLYPCFSVTKYPFPVYLRVPVFLCLCISMPLNVWMFLYPWLSVLYPCNPATCIPVSQYPGVSHSVCLYPCIRVFLYPGIHECLFNLVFLHPCIYKCSSEFPKTLFIRWITLSVRVTVPLCISESICTLCWVSQYPCSKLP